MNNNKEYRYQLESKKLTGHQPRKLTCPQCGRRKCLVRYVDTRNGNSYLSDEVGKCDHLNSCGYHYTPADYYRDHHSQAASPAGKPYTPPMLPPFQPLPMQYVRRSHSPQSTLWQWIAGSVAPRLAITPERVSPLQGRRVTLFPDSGCYQKWTRQMQLTTGILWNMSPRMECYAPNTDLADLVLGEAHDIRQ